MNNRKIFLWELASFVFTVVIGSLLHFCFEWSGGYKPFAIICAVNESVWEHLKLGFWPFFLFALIEYFIFGKEKPNFWFGKALGLFIIPAVITLGFYSYTAVLGTHNLAIDIALFVISILLAYIVSFKITVSTKDYSAFKNISIVFILLAVILFSLLTYFPPKLEIFRDPRNGSYGIPK